MRAGSGCDECVRRAPTQGSAVGAGCAAAGGVECVRGAPQQGEWARPGQYRDAAGRCARRATCESCSDILTVMFQCAVSMSPRSSRPERLWHLCFVQAPPKQSPLTSPPQPPPSTSPPAPEHTPPSRPSSPAVSPAATASQPAAISVHMCRLRAWGSPYSTIKWKGVLSPS